MYVNLLLLCGGQEDTDSLRYSTSGVTFHYSAFSFTLFVFCKIAISFRGGRSGAWADAQMSLSRLFRGTEGPRIGALKASERDITGCVLLAPPCHGTILASKGWSVKNPHLPICRYSIEWLPPTGAWIGDQVIFIEICYYLLGTWSAFSYTLSKEMPLHFMLGGKYNV